MANGLLGVFRFCHRRILPTPMFGSWCLQIQLLILLISLQDCSASKQRPPIRSMTVSTASSEQTVVQERPNTQQHHRHTEDIVDYPAWAADKAFVVEWGEQLIVPEWEDKDDFRANNGWRVRNNM